MNNTIDVHDNVAPNGVVMAGLRLLRTQHDVVSDNDDIINQVILKCIDVLTDELSGNPNRMLNLDLNSLSTADYALGMMLNDKMVEQIDVLT